MNEVSIRLLTDKDKENFTELYKVITRREFDEYSARVKQYFTDGLYLKRMVELPFKVGAFIDNRLIGYVIGDYPFGGIVFLSWVAVDKKYQGRGVGKKLMAFIEPLLKERGVHSIHLQTVKKNLPFYKTCGYEIFGEDDKGYFGVHDYLLRKVIQNAREDKFFGQSH